MKKYRILIIVMTTRRDIGAMFVLAKLLESMGCECYLAGASTYRHISTRLWAPHAVIVGSITRIKTLADAYPNSEIFYYAGEGGESYPRSLEKEFAENQPLFDRLRRIYLWGDLGLKHIKRRIEELGETCFLHGNTKLDEKSKVIGHPRLDIIRFNPQQKKENDKRIFIGLVGRFNLLNAVTIAQRTPLFRIFHDYERIGNEMTFQILLLKTYIRLINQLDPQKYRISLRPYPLENFNQYLNSEFVKSGKVEIDQSLEFGTWATCQDIILGAASSTISQIAMSKRPFINLDALNQRTAVAYVDSIRETFMGHIEDHCPKTFEELLEMIENYPKLAVTSEKFNQVMDDIYHCDSEDSCLWSVAKDVVENLQASAPKRTKMLPKKCMQLVHELRFREDPSSYGHFCYSHEQQKLEKELGVVVDEIIKFQNG